MNRGSDLPRVAQIVSSTVTIQNQLVFKHFVSALSTFSDFQKSEKEMLLEFSLEEGCPFRLTWYFACRGEKEGKATQT